MVTLTCSGFLFELFNLLVICSDEELVLGITDVTLMHRPGGGMLHVQLGRSILARVKKAVVTGEVQREDDREAGKICFGNIHINKKSFFNHVKLIATFLLEKIVQNFFS